MDGSADPLPWREALDALLGAGATKREIADLIGASRRTIHRLARGDHERPHRAALVGLVRVARERGLLAA